MPTQETPIRIDYDNQPDDAAYMAINAVNELLKDKNISFNIEDDNLPHDGFIILNIKLVES